MPFTECFYVEAFSGIFLVRKQKPPLLPQMVHHFSVKNIHAFNGWQRKVPRRNEHTLFHEKTNNK